MCISVHWGAYSVELILDLRELVAHLARVFYGTVFNSILEYGTQMFA